MKKIFALLLLLVISSGRAASAKTWDQIFDQGSMCTGSPFSVDDVRKYLSPGDTEAVIGRYQVAGRYRVCNDVTGCTKWRPSDVTGQDGAALEDYALVDLKTDNSSRGYQVALFHYFRGSATSGGKTALNMDLTNSAANQFSSSGRNYGIYELVQASAIIFDDGSYARYTGKFASDCGWFMTQARSSKDGSGNYFEGQIVVYGNH